MLMRHSRPWRSGVILTAVAVAFAPCALAAQTRDRQDVRDLSRAITEAVTAAIDESIREATGAVDEALRELPGGRQTPAQSGSRSGTTDAPTRKLNIGTSGIVEVYATSRGSITITVGTGPATVTVERRTPARTGGSAAGSLYSIEESRDRVRIRPRDSADVSFKLVVPAGTEIHAQSVAGPIAISGLRGDVEAHSTSGLVTIADVDTTDDVTVGDTAGMVSLTRIKARRVNVEVVEGLVTATDVAARFATIRSTSGALVYRGTLAHNGRYELKTHNGPVRFEPSGAVGFEIDAQTYSGAIDVGIPLKVSTKGSSGRRTISGTSGDGDATVVISTFSGTVTIGKNGGS
jgi:hypothetical protein